MQPGKWKMNPGLLWPFITMFNYYATAHNAQNECKYQAVFVLQRTDQTGFLLLTYQHRRTGTFRLGGAVTFLPEKFKQFPNAWLLKSGYRERTQISRKTNSFPITMWQEVFLEAEFNFADVGFSGFDGKKSRIWISDFTRGNDFSRNSCTVYLKVTKMESVWLFSLHCLQPISLKFSNVKKGVKFCWILLERV